MTEEETQTQENTQENTQAETATEAAPAQTQEAISPEEAKELKQALESLKNEKKEKIVERILELNTSMSKETLMAESEKELSLRLEYEEKMQPQSNAIVEADDQPEAGLGSRNGFGDWTFTQESYDKFNAELREKYR